MIVLEQYESFKQISYGAGPFVYFVHQKSIRHVWAQWGDKYCYNLMYVLV